MALRSRRSPPSGPTLTKAAGDSVRETPSARSLESKPLKFMALAEDLRRGIKAGTWPVGTKLPTEQELVRSTGYSLNTVRHAIDVLVNDEHVERRHGAGMFVIERIRRQSLGRVAVGVLLPDTSQYFPKILQGIETVLSAANSSLVLASYGYDPAREDEAVKSILDTGVDGLLLVPTIRPEADQYEQATRLLGLSAPVVLVERNFSALGPIDPTEYVCSNHQTGAFEAVRHLHSMGHTRIALCLREKSITGSSIRLGYEAAIAQLGIEAPLVISASKESWEATRANAVIEQLLENRSTAALVFGDREAAILEGAARRKGVSIPEDFALVSYDDETADIAEVPLTAVSPHKNRVGRLAAQILLQRLDEGDESPVHQIYVKPRIVVRDSCGALVAAALTLTPDRASDEKRALSRS